MAKCRLNETYRNLLRAFAEDNLVIPEKEKMDKAWRKASELTQACVEKQYPPADMALLKKYGVATDDTCFQGADPDGLFLRIEVDKETPEILVPYNGGCHSRTIKFDAKTRDAVGAYEKAIVAYNEARNKKLTMYRSLIRASYYFEDVVEVWPAAEALRDKICQSSKALVALNPDIISFIKSDNAGSIDKIEASA